MQLRNYTDPTKRYQRSTINYQLIAVLALWICGTSGLLHAQNDTRLAMAAAAAPARIKIYRLSQIQAETILLRDVAGIEADSPELLSRLRQVALGKLQQLNKPLKLYPDWIRTRLRAAGFDAGQFALECPNGALVERVGTEIPEDEVRLALELFVQKQLPFPAESLRLNQLQLRGAGEPIPVGRRGYEVQAQLDPSNPGRVPFAVEVKVENRSVRRLTGSVNVDVQVNVIKTAAALPRETVVQPQHLQIVPTSLSEIPRNAVLAPQQIVGMVASRPLQPGAFIKTNDLKALELVQRNQPVFIILEKGAMKITTRGVALQSGARGELVQVRNLSSNKLIHAQVIDRQLVQVVY